MYQQYNINIMHQNQKKKKYYYYCAKIVVVNFKYNICSLRIQYFLENFNTLSASQIFTVCVCLCLDPTPGGRVIQKDGC